MRSSGNRVLVFVDWFDPAFRAGGPVRSVVNLVKGLEDDIDFFILTSDKDYLDPDTLNVEARDKWIQYGRMAKVKYKNKSSLSYRSVLREIRTVGPDTIYINGIFSFRFSILPLIVAHYYRMNVIVSPRGMLAPTALGLKRMKKKFYLNLASLAGWFSGVYFHASKENEVDEIQRVMGPVKITMIPNIPVLFQRKVKKKATGTLRLLMLSRIAREKNNLYAMKVLSTIQDSTLKIQLNIYGEVTDRDYWSECESVIDRLPENIQVQLYAPINPALLQNIFDDHHCLFLPTLGENYGHAIAESLSAGLPVIISNLTPWRGLEYAGAGYDLNLKFPELFCKSIVNFASMDAKNYDEWSLNAVRFVMKQVRYPELIKDYRNLFQS